MSSQPNSTANKSAPWWAMACVTTLFFAWGFATVLTDSLVPKLKGLFALSYSAVMLTQSSFFLAYLFVSLPAGFLLMRVGYVRGIVTGLLIMAAGCLLFVPAALIGVFPGFLAALFTMAVGITILQVAANPLIALLGSEATSHSRLNLAQGFNSLATTIGPLVGAALILANGVALPDVQKIGPAAFAILRRTEVHSLEIPFLGIAPILLVLASVFWFLRKSIVVPRADKAANLSSTLALLRNPRLGLGAVSIFIYVGAEVSIGSMMTNYLMLPHTLGLVAARAGQVVSLYWGGAMVGRFIGSAVLRYVRAGTALMVCAVIAMLLALTSSASAGTLAAITIVAIGLFNSIMFPTIFTLAIEGEGGDTPQASGLLCMAIFGGAIIPEIVGAVADRFGLSVALVVPALCYVWIAYYGWMGRRPVKASGVAVF
jgi:FHS family L-fucose permease-like MFS transporter